MIKNNNYIGRAYVKIRYAKDPGMHKNRSSEESTRKVLSHLQYIAYRSREHDKDKNTYGLFNKNEDKASLKEFYKKIENDPALKHSNTIKLHKLTIGFHRDWYERYEMNYKNLTRYIMHRLEERKGMKLDWVAAEHLKDTSPHAHIAIKSTGKDEAGNTVRLKITSEDIDFIKEEIDKYTGREQLLERDKSLERDDFGLTKDFFKEISKVMDKVSREGEFEIEKAKIKAEKQKLKEKDRERGRDR